VLLVRALLDGPFTAAAVSQLVAESFEHMQLAGGGWCDGDDGEGTSAVYCTALAALAALGGLSERLRVGARVQVDDCCGGAEAEDAPRATGVVVHCRRLGASATVALDHTHPQVPVEVPCTSLRLVAAAPTLGQLSCEQSVLPLIKFLLEAVQPAPSDASASAAARLAVLRSAALRALPTVVSAAGAGCVVASGVLAPLMTLALSTASSPPADLDARLVAAAQIHLDMRLYALHAPPSSPQLPRHAPLHSQPQPPSAAADVGSHPLGESDAAWDSDASVDRARQTQASLRRLSTLGSPSGTEAAAQDSPGAPPAIASGALECSEAPRVDLLRNDGPFQLSEQIAEAVCDAGRSMFGGEMEGLLVRGQANGVRPGMLKARLAAGSVRAADCTVPPTMSSRVWVSAAEPWSLIDLVLDQPPRGGRNAGEQKPDSRASLLATLPQACSLTLTRVAGRGDAHRAGVQRASGGVGYGRREREADRERAVLGRAAAGAVGGCSLDAVAPADVAVYMPLQARPACRLERTGVSTVKKGVPGRWFLDSDWGH
jgi:hypothetical protein